MFTVQEWLAATRVDVEAHPVVIIYQAAPVQQVHHGLKAEDGLLRHARVVRKHGRACSQFDWYVCLCPSHLLQPRLQHAGTVLDHRQWLQLIPCSL